MFLGIFASVGVVYFSQTSTSKPQGSALPFWFLGAIFILGFLLIFLFTLAEYRRRTYDPVLILKWQEIFDDMKNERDAAARAMIEYLSVPKSDRNWRRVAKAKPANLEDVFDFLDDLGFYMEGSQFSSEVVHHHFYNWIRIYLQEGLSYITQNRANKHEPKKWYHCESLLKQVEEIETTQNPFETNLNWDDDKLKEYLSYEVINAN